MTLFRFDMFKRQGKDEPVAWDGMKPPGLSFRSLYYDLKWHYRLNEVDGLPASARLFFAFLKALQLIAYKKGWNEGGKE